MCQMVMPGASFLLIFINGVPLSFGLFGETYFLCHMCVDASSRVLVEYEGGGRPI